MNNMKYDLGFWTPYLEDWSHVIIYSPDRLSRHMLSGLKYLEDLTSRNISVHFVTTEIIYHKNISSANKAMIQSELLSAEKYSNDISFKAKATITRLKNDGHVFGRAPYGFQNIMIDGIRKRVPNNDERDNITRIRSRYFEMHENYGADAGADRIRPNQSSLIKFLTRWCIREGLKSRNGSPFTSLQIKKIIE